MKQQANVSSQQLSKGLILKPKAFIMFEKDLFSANVVHIDIFIYQVLLRIKYIRPYCGTPS